MHRSTPPQAAPERVNIEGPAGLIEAVLEDPGEDGDSYAIVCHPHPQFGGTMDNKVVTTLARALQSCAIATLRFNFRGVGRSAGTFDGGVGETDDALAVADWGAARWPDRSLMVAGFSFGAYVALRLSQRREARRFILVAPPVGRFDFSVPQAPNAPCMVIQGDADDVVDPEAVRRWALAAAPAPKLLMMPGAGHFFHGRLTDLRDAVTGEIRSV